MQCLLHSVPFAPPTVAAFSSPRQPACLLPGHPRTKRGHSGCKEDVRARLKQARFAAPASSVDTAQQTSADSDHLDVINFHGVHHVGVLVQDLDKSKEFYCDTLGLAINQDRPDGKLPYDGLWLWMGPEMLHLMVLPNPDPLSGRPDHGGRDRHVCVGVESIKPVEQRLKANGVQYTSSKSGRAAVFFRDPDMNVLEVFESNPWR